jgi:hypothetical protein
MTTIYKEFIVEAGIDSAWDALRDFNAVHQRLAPGFVVDCKPGEGSRTVTFANGMVAQEVLMGIHEAAHRLSYTVVGGKASHHSRRRSCLPKAKAAPALSGSPTCCRTRWETTSTR